MPVGRGRATVRDVISSPVDLAGELDRLLSFGEVPAHPSGGFAYLDERGRPRTDQTAPLWITARMTHVYSLAQLVGRPGAADLVDRGVTALRGAFLDPDFGGWFAAVTPDGRCADDGAKTAYGHAFVVLAASSAAQAGHPDGPDLLDAALAVVDQRFWDPSTEMVLEEWDRSFARLDDYRGLNAAMHFVEAFLAAADVTGDALWRDRAAAMVSRVVGEIAPGFSWRLPEHYDRAWQPLLDYHRDEPAHPFRPFGATIGHWLEWARLALHLRAALGPAAPSWLIDHARSLIEAAFVEGWRVDGADGFVYTVDFGGRPVVRQRMHWVVAEGIAACAALGQVDPDASTTARYQMLWEYAEAHLIDRRHGSWHHELGPDNRPGASTWPGKPDLYHAVQATLIPRLPLSPALAPALAAGLLAPSSPDQAPGEA